MAGVERPEAAIMAADPNPTDQTVLTWTDDTTI